MNYGPIRILHVLTAMNRAGTETLLMNLYRAIDRNIIQFDFAVTAVERCDYDDEIEAMGGRIIHYPRYIGKNHFTYKKWWNDFFRNHPEYRVVHGHIGSTAAIYLKIAKKYNRYAIAHSHSTKSRLSLKSIMYQFYSFPTRYIADYFFGCSKQALIDRYGRRVANTSLESKVLNNAIDAQKFVFSESVRKRIRQEYAVAEGKTVIGTVGRLTPQKNPCETIRICKKLKEDGLDYLFWWFGAGELEDEVKTQINMNDLQDCVLLLGTRGDIYDVLQGMDIFLFPSVWEGLGISCVEAQAAGLPTLCSETVPVEAQVTELIAFLPLNDTDVWCNKIKEVLLKIRSPDYQRPDTYQSIVGAGYEITDVAHYLEEFYMDKANAQ